LDTVEFASRCCVCMQKAVIKYERTSINQAGVYEFRCIGSPVHAGCTEYFKQLQAAKSGAPGPRAFAASAGVM
jgi:hypothetical protein